MGTYKHPLSSVKIASPCSADWEDMFGGDRKRFCGSCELNVYNLSDMTKREAEQLINQAEGRLCVRFYRRSDGTILTKDCPVGLRAIKQRFSRVRTAAVSSVLGFLAGLGWYSAVSETDRHTVMGVMAQEVPIGGNGLPIREEKFEAPVGRMVIERHNPGGLADEPPIKYRSRKTRSRSIK